MLSLLPEGMLSRTEDLYVLYHWSNVLFYVDWNRGLLFAKYNWSTVLFLHSTTEALNTFCACLKYHWISVKNAVKIHSTTKSSCGLVCRLIKYHWLLLCFSLCVWSTTKTLWFSVLFSVILCRFKLSLLNHCAVLFGFINFHWITVDLLSTTKALLFCVSL